MQHIYKKLLGIFIALLTGFYAVAAVNTTAQTDAPQVQVNPEWGGLTMAILHQVSRQHYQPVNLALAEHRNHIFTDYIDSLDSSRTLFFRQDIESMSVMGGELLKDTYSGNLQGVIDIYNHYLRRSTERMHYQIGLIDELVQNLQSPKDTSLLIDREDIPRSETEQALKVLWKQLLVNDIINLHLQEKDISAEEIAERLHKRFKRRLHRLGQVRADEVYQAYINILLHRYDPHTSYISKNGTEDFEMAMSNSLEGIGALLSNDEDYIKIERITKGGPAELDGRLQPEDRISGVGQGEDGEITDIVGWRTDEAVRLIRGPKGSKVRLRVLPKDSTDSREIVITRDKVLLENQVASGRVIETEHEGKPWRIGLVTLPSFYQELRPDPNTKPSSASIDVQKEARKLLDDDIDALLLDLRFNGGGSLEEAEKIAAMFLGRRPIVQIKQGGGHLSVEQDYYAKTPYDVELGVLVGPYSASASEIVAAAIQDYARGVIIGQRTHGKGSVQIVNFLGEGLLKITTAKFFRVSGGSTQKRGVVPDVTLPTLFDTEESGERQYPTALAWEAIKPLYETRLETGRIKKLQQLHESRRQKLPQLTYIDNLLQRAERLRARKYLPLDLQERTDLQIQDRELLLSIENRRALAENRSAFANYQELKDWQEEQRKLEPKEREDIELQEAVRVLIDYLKVKDSSYMADAA